MPATNVWGMIGPMPRNLPCPIAAMPADGGARDADIERLRQDVRALRDEIAGEQAAPAAAGMRAPMIAGGIAGMAIAAACLAGGSAIDWPILPGWAEVAEIVPAQAAVGIVERIFTVY